MTYIYDLKNSVKQIELRTILYDAVSFLLFYLSYFLWSLYTLGLADMVEALDIPSDPYMMTEGQAELAYNAMQMYLMKAAVATTILIISALIIFTLTKYLIWSHILKKDFKIKTYLKFLLKTTIYATFSVTILYLIGSRLYPVPQLPLIIAFYAAAIFLAYIGTLVMLHFTATPSLSSVKHAIQTSFTKIKFYILPIATLFIPLIIVWNLFMLIPQFILVFCLILILWMAWSRSYLLYVTESIK